MIVRGKRKPNVTAKDYILLLLSMEYIRSGKALAKVMEYSGEAIEALSVDERATMTNMAAEIGGFTGIVAPDQKTVEFLVERRGMSRAEAEKYCEGLFSDPDAQYAHVIELNADEITPMVATPGDPGNGKFIRDLNTPVPVEIAYGGTCTARTLTWICTPRSSPTRCNKANAWPSLASSISSLARRRRASTVCAKAILIFSNAWAQS